MGIDNIFQFMRVANEAGDRCVLNRDSLAAALEKYEEACSYAQAARVKMRDAYAMILARRDDITETLVELEDCGPEEFTDTMSLLSATNASLDDMLALSEKITEDLTHGIDALQTQEAHGRAGLVTLESALEILRGFHAE